LGNIAIIPARGGSKRIPRKNIKLFLGKPILAYSIEAALESNLFDEVMVSTEDEEIASIAIKYGATIPFKRSLENAGDFSTTVDVILEVIEEYKKIDKYYENGCCIYPTAAFVTKEKLKKGLSLLKKNNYDTVLPVLRYSFPIQRAFKQTTKGKIKMFFSEFLETRSQDLEEAFHDAGQFYWFNITRLESSKKLWTENTGMIAISDLEAHDIDTIADWHTAEFKFKANNERKNSIS